MKKSLKSTGLFAITCLTNSFLAYPAISQVQTFRPLSAPSSPYSGATRAGNTIYARGAIGLSDNEKSLVPGGIEEEANAAFDHVIAMVEKAGGEKTDIAKCIVLVSKIDYFPALKKSFYRKISYSTSHKINNRRGQNSDGSSNRSRMYSIQQAINR